MGPVTGVVLVLCLMTLIFMGPEWAVALGREFRGLRKADPPQ
ncbi:MAG: hypothetical protein H6Q00_3214 [Holophagaceae bacterium]|nr:hypothetical protein [Holophagaceae bacterium]